MCFKTFFYKSFILSIFLTSAAHASDVITVQGSVEICLTTSIPLTPPNTYLTKIQLKTRLGKAEGSEPHTKLSIEVTSTKNSQEYVYPIEFIFDQESGEGKESTTLKCLSQLGKDRQSRKIHYPPEILNKKLAAESIQKAIDLIDGLAPNTTAVLKTALEVRKLLKQTQDDACKVKIENGSQNIDH